MIPRKEYPRPNFVRENWLNLNGKWNFEFDDEKIGLAEKWYENNKFFSKEINVPFAFQSELSSINDTEFHDCFWYERTFKVSEEWRLKRIKLNFGAVDYRCKIFINKKFVGEHEGGHVGFSFDITDFLNFEEETITIWVEDPSRDEMIPRGKQFWKEKSESIWYTRTSGIWQTVWLEPVEACNINSIKLTPIFDEGSLKIESDIKNKKDKNRLKIKILFKNEILIDDEFSLNSEYFNKTLNIFDNKILRSNAHSQGWTWTPETPNLFDIEFTLLDDNKVLDKVSSYFGMRKVHIENGMFFLNNRPYYQKLLLDQGYWPQGLLTAPNDEDFIKDIQLSKDMGFNGCRKHQKVEDSRFFYWADKLGFLVWGELANCIEYSSDAVERITKEWISVIKNYYNHPSLITWVPINESWGVPRVKFDEKEQSHTLAMYYLTKSLDTTRMVISNDGWELTKTDICGIHNYNHGNSFEKERQIYFKETLKTKESLLNSMPAGKKIYADGFEHEKHTPVMLTEFGGICYDEKHPDGWGYSSVKSADELVQNYERIIEAIFESEAIYGFCYTQITDVEQETNGLLTYDRKPKCDLEKIKLINNRFIREKIIK
ncbi:MAG: glycoside hydrolase family 2 protein [Cetobacterium sp.]